MIPNLPDGETETSCVELAQQLYDDLRAKGYSGEVLNNAHQLVKKVQNEAKELSNVDHREEEPVEEDGIDQDHLEEDAERLDDIEEDVEQMKALDEEEEGKDEEMPDYSKMSKDDMGKDLKKRGILTITIVPVGPKQR